MFSSHRFLQHSSKPSKFLQNSSKRTGPLSLWTIQRVETSHLFAPQDPRKLCDSSFYMSHLWMDSLLCYTIQYCYPILWKKIRRNYKWDVTFIEPCLMRQIKLIYANLDGKSGVARYIFHWNILSLLTWEKCINLPICHFDFVPSPTITRSRLCCKRHLYGTVYCLLLQNVFNV